MGVPQPSSTPSNNTSGNPGTSISGPPGSPMPRGLVVSPYKDVTSSANWNTGEIMTKVNGSPQPLHMLLQGAGLQVATWAFATGECGSENWGGMEKSIIAANIQAWQGSDVKYIISAGGAAGSFTCGSDAGFFAFIDTYYSDNLVGIDFDIESSGAVAPDLVARVKAAQGVAKYQNLRFSFTVPSFGYASQDCFSAIGTSVFQAIKAAGLQSYYINLMTMDFGASGCTGSPCDMGASSINAAKVLNTMHGVPYSQIEITPMIGNNDVQGEVFTLQDATMVAQFVASNGLGGLHWWCWDRDTPVGCVGSTSASPLCNSVGTAPLDFAHAFVQGL